MKNSLRADSSLSARGHTQAGRPEPVPPEKRFLIAILTPWALAVLICCLAFLTATSGCSAKLAPDQLAIGPHRFTVEIADTDETRARGLMFRESLPPRHGMLFVFPDDAHRSFWMRDTRIPLSIAFICRDGTIAEIYDMQPFSLEPVISVAKVRYALEVNQNEFRRLGIQPGDHVDFPGSVGR